MCVATCSPTCIASHMPSMPMLYVWAVPNSSDVTLTFESFVTTPDLKKALRQHEALASVLGVNLSSDKELDALFEKHKLDSDGDTAITRGEWRDFVKRLHAAAMARKQASKHADMHFVHALHGDMH